MQMTDRTDRDEPQMHVTDMDDIDEMTDEMTDANDIEMTEINHRCMGQTWMTDTK